MDNQFQYVFPAIRGIQAKREYYVSMCPLRLIPKIFLFNEAELVPELRAQRILNKNRIPEMSRYLTDNPGDYVFSAITASVDGELHFEPIGAEAHADRMGILHISMDARFIINDGQHRRAAIEHAIRDKPELADESIAVVFFVDAGLRRCQQMFADLNRYAIRPSRSLGVLYDSRDDSAKLAKLVALKAEVFQKVVELERSCLSERSSKLFTLSAVYTAVRALLDGCDGQDSTTLSQIAIEFWDEVGKQMPEWELVRTRQMRAGEVRRDFIHSHGIAIQAFGTAGNALLRVHSKDWKRRLKALSKIDWTRDNTALWEGRALIGGSVSKASNNVILTCNVVKKALSLELTPEETRIEHAFSGAKNGR